MFVGVLIRLLLLTLLFKEYKLVLMRIFKFKYTKYTEQMIFVFFFRAQWLSKTSYFLDFKMFSKLKCWLFGTLMCSKVLSNKISLGSFYHLLEQKSFERIQWENIWDSFWETVKSKPSILWKVHHLRHCGFGFYNMVYTNILFQYNELDTTSSHYSLR